MEKKIRCNKCKNLINYNEHITCKTENYNGRDGNCCTRIVCKDCNYCYRCYEGYYRIINSIKYHKNEIEKITNKSTKEIEIIKNKRDEEVTNHKDSMISSINEKKQKYNNINKYIKEEDSVDLRFKNLSDNDNSESEEDFVEGCYKNYCRDCPDRGLQWDRDEGQWIP